MTNSLVMPPVDPGPEAIDHLEGNAKPLREYKDALRQITNEQNTRRRPMTDEPVNNEPAPILASTDDTPSVMPEYNPDITAIDFAGKREAEPLSGIELREQSNGESGNA